MILPFHYSGPGARTVSDAALLFSGAACAFLDAVPLAGWLLHVPALTRLGPSFSPMAANTAAGLLLDGAALLFIAGAAYLFVASFRGRQREGADAARQGQGSVSPWRVAGMAFGVIFVAEWGDITQLATANLAARYNPVLVLTGATLGLWVATALAVVIGAKSLSMIPMSWVSRIAGVILLALGSYAAVAALRG